MDQSSTSTRPERTADAGEFQRGASPSGIRKPRVGLHQTNQRAQEQAGRSFIEWVGVKVLPRSTKESPPTTLIHDKADRAKAITTPPEKPTRTSCAWRRRTRTARLQPYRGVGFFQAPLVESSGEENYLRLATANSTCRSLIFRVTVRRGMARYRMRIVRANEDHTVKLDGKPFMPLSDAREQLMTEMKAALVKQGLYVKEAQAMVNTWKDQWFTEEGTRVLYLLPRGWTDRTLPLTITPLPNDVVRVMVGRAELITPTMEWELNKQVVFYSQGSADAKAQAVADVRKLALGRFMEPAVRKILGRNPNKEFAQAAWSLAQEASKSVDGKVSAVASIVVRTRPGCDSVTVVPLGSRKRDAGGTGGRRDAPTTFCVALHLRVLRLSLRRKSRACIRAGGARAGARAGGLVVRRARPQLIVAQQQTLLYQGVVDALAKDATSWAKDSASLPSTPKRFGAIIPRSWRTASTICSCAVVLRRSRLHRSAMETFSPLPCSIARRRGFRLNNDRFLGSCESVAVLEQSQRRDQPDKLDTKDVFGSR
jgi:hypothetical protein